jgi:hypothetical protein
MGPVEVAVYAFPGSRFNGAILPALRALIEDGTVRVIDLAVVARGTDGTVTAFEIEEVLPDVPELEGFGAEAVDLLNDEDIMLLAEEVAPGSTAAIVVWEHTWAARLAEAIEGSGGVVVAREYVPEPVVDAAFAALDQ